MKKKALRKEFRTEIRKSLNRFLSILFIVALGVMIFAGVHASAPDMRATGDYYFDLTNLMDLRVISTLGITEDDLKSIGEIEGIQSVYGSYMEDVYCQEADSQEVLHFEAILEDMNELTVEEGRLPEKAGECFLDSEYAREFGYAVGDTLEIQVDSEDDSTLIRRSYTISGYGYSPNYISFVRGSTTLGTGSLSGFVYVLPGEFDCEVYSVAYMHVAGAKEQMEFTDGYDELVDAVYDRLEGIADARCEIRYNEIMEEAQSELDEAKQEVADGKQELEDAKQELADGKAEAESELAEAESELLDGEQQLADGKQELEDAKQELADGQQELADGEREIEENAQTLADARSQIADARKKLTDGEAEYKAGLKEYNASTPGAKAELEAAQQQIDDGQAQLDAGWVTYNENLAAIESGETQLAAAEEQLKAGQAAYDASYAGAKAELDAGLAEYEAGMTQITEGKAACEAGAAQLAQQQTEYEAGRAQLDAAWSSYKEGKAQVDAGLAQIAQAETQAASLKTAYEAAQQSVDSLSAEVETLETQIASLPGEIIALKADLAELESQRATAVSDKSAAEQTVTEKASDIQAKNDKIAENEVSIASAQSILDKADATADEKAAAQTQIKNLTEENEALQADVANLEEEKSQAQAKADEAAQKISQADAAISEKNREITEKQEALVAAQNNLPVKEAELQTAQTTLASAKAAYEAAQQAVDSLSAQKAELQKASAELAATEQVLNEQEAEMTAGKAQLDAAQATLARKQAELTAGEAQLAAAKQQIDAGYAELEAAGQELEAGWSELNAKKQELAAGRAALEQAKSQMEASQSELNAAQAQVNSGYAELTKAEKQLKSARQELDLGWAQLNASQAQISDGERQLADGRSQLAEARAEIADGLKQIEDAEKEIAENETKIKDGWEDYEEGKKEAEEEIAEGEQKIKDAEEELLEAEEKIRDAEEELADIKFPKWYVDDRSVLKEHTGFGENAERLTNIAQVFPLLFFLVAALISLTTMTRMVEEERTQIGTLKALGYSKMDIAGKYLKYAFFATVGGSLLGILIGEKFLPWVIIKAYGTMYVYLPKIIMPYHWSFGLAATAIALVCTIGATTSACYRALQTVPAQLMRPPAPKVGKRVLLEYIPFIWRNLSFSWKSTIRNLMRYKKRCLMTLIGIGGCMGLLLVGYGLRDSIMDIAVLQFDELQKYDAMVVLDTDADDKEIENALTAVQEDTRITQQKRFYMQREKVQNIEGKAGKEWSVYLYVTEDIEEISEFFCFRDRETHEEYTLTDEGAIITEKIAKEFDLQPGDTITLKREDGDPVTIPISAVCENYLSHYMYLTPTLYEQVYGEEPEYNSLFFMSEESQEMIEEIGASLLENDAVLNITYTRTMAASVDDMLGALNSVMLVFIGAAGALAFVVLYNLNNININERRRELATLKVLGFFDGEVGAYVYRENVILTVVGAFLGCFIGKVLHMFIIITVEVDSCMFGRNIKPMSFVIGTLFTFAFSIIVNWVMYFKLKKIDMVESLKSIE